MGFASTRAHALFLLLIGGCASRHIAPVDAGHRRQTADAQILDASERHPKDAASAVLHDGAFDAAAAVLHDAAIDAAQLDAGSAAGKKDAGGPDVHYLKASAPELRGFGGRVALSQDRLAVTATDNQHASAAAVEVWNRASGHWQHEARLELPDGARSVPSGHSSIDLDGDTLIVGATAAEAVFVFTRGTDGWSLFARVPSPSAQSRIFFGASVATSGNTIAIGAPFENAADKTGSGAVYVFLKTGTGYSQQAHLIATKPAQGDGFGASVTLDANTLCASAPYDDTESDDTDAGQATAADSGAAYVFVRERASWRLQARLQADRPDPTVPALQGGDQFGGGEALAGRGVWLSGDTLVVGAGGEDSVRDPTASDSASRYAIDTGAAYVFRRSNDTWARMARLTPPDPQGGSQFGSSVALDGERLIVGAWQHGRDSSGAAYSYRWAGSAWIAERTLRAPNAHPDDYFGWSVAVSPQALAVGAPRAAGGGLGLDADAADSNSPGAGAVYVFP